MAADICPSAARFGLETYPPNVEILKMRHEVISLDLEKDPFPFEDESIDVVMSNQVLEHVKEIFWILHQVSRVIRVGGYMIIGVPNLASFHNRLLLLFGMQPTSIQNHSAHVRGYTKHDIMRMLQMIFQMDMSWRTSRVRIFTPCRRPRPSQWQNCCQIAHGVSSFF
jgi:predicted SAM-dependent methyltransferase